MGVALTWGGATLTQNEKPQISQKIQFMQKWHKYICICTYLAIKCDQCSFCMKCTF